ncbi:MAG TPA: M64 family metallopeptidase [Vicinamibacteria bacterium]|jgi:hypothetical protein
MSAPEVRTLRRSGDPLDKFNMVILGDGFQQRELPAFNKHARLLAKRLLKIGPFNRVATRINVYSVSTASVDSGVTMIGAPKDTFYGVQGSWLGPGDFPGHFGTPFQDRIVATAGLAAPEQAPGVRIVIVNYDADGGRGSHADRTVFVPLYAVDETGAPVSSVQQKKDFVEFTAHECGHAIADLAEEYISCNPHTVGELHRNQQTPEETAVNPMVKWRPLARPRELDAKGTFKVVHNQGDKMASRNSEPPGPVVGSGLTGMLGLYWGCMDVDPAASAPASSQCDPWEDPRGAPFYRSMARCRMRFQTQPFCRVCADGIQTIIQEATK